MLKNVVRVSLYGLYTKHTLIMLEVQYKYVTHRSSTVDICCHTLAWRCTIQLPYRKEGNVLFNDTLNTFYLQLYGIRHMVEDHSDSEKGNLLPPHFTFNRKGSFICTIPQTVQHIPQPLLHQSWSTAWNKK